VTADFLHFVLNDGLHLIAHRQAAIPQLDDETFLLDRFQKTRPQASIDPDRRLDDLLGQGFVFRDHPASLLVSCLPHSFCEGDGTHVARSIAWPTFRPRGPIHETR
jgi:hypothetical protein